jgi:TRAP-type C4-dicarboxylate transport system substrate-binding protein
MSSFLFKNGGRKNIFFPVLPVVLIILSAGYCHKDKVPEQDEINLRIINVGYTSSEDHPYRMYLESWGKAVSEATEGRYVFEIFPADIYGPPNELIKGCQSGQCDMVLAAGSLLSAYSSKVGVLNLPFLYDNSMQACEILNGPIGEELDDSLALNNLIVLGWWENGMHHLFLSRPVDNPGDLKGARLRVANYAEVIDTINAFGAIAVPMSFDDVYAAWQSEAIDGCEDTSTHMITRKYYELTQQGVLLWYRHVPNSLIMAKALWDTIPEIDKAIFLNEARKMSEFSFEYQREMEEMEIERCENLGVVFTRPDRKSFVKLVIPVYAKYYPQYREILDKIFALTH